MNLCKTLVCSTLFAGTLLTITQALAETPETVNQAVNFFENAKATGGAPFTVDARSEMPINDEVELPGFAFKVYDVDFTPNSLTMTLTADLEKLQITLYDKTTFDRYYYAFDKAITAAEIAVSTDENFKAMVEIVSPGTQVSSKGSFIDGLPTDYTFDNGGILITIGEGTDLTKIKNNGGSLTVNF